MGKTTESISNDTNYVCVQTSYQKLKSAGKDPGISLPNMDFKIRLACRPEEYNNKYPNFSLVESVIDEFKETCTEEMGIAGIEDISYYVALMRHSINMAGYFAHNIPITEDKFKAFSYILLALAVYDDEIDEVAAVVGKSVSVVGYEDVISFNKLMMGILSGMPMSKISLDDIMFPRGYAILKFLEKYHQLAVSSIENYNELCVEMLKGVSEHLGSQVLAVLESKSKDCGTIDSYIFRRERTSGFYPTWEFCKLMHGIVLTHKHENSVLLRQIIRCSVIISSLLNDLFSWEREKDGIVGQNYISINIRLGRKVADIAEELIQKINDDISEMLRLSDLIENTLGQDLGGLNLSKFLLMLKCSVDGNTWLHLLTPRYCKGIEYHLLKN